MNNYERIKHMSVDEMAEFIKNGTYDCNCCPANLLVAKNKSNNGYYRSASDV